MLNSRCISASLSQSTGVLSGIIICAEGGADVIWNWVEDEGVSRGGGRDVVGDVGEVRISLKRSSIAASETASVSCWESVGNSIERC